ncbi:unnamed protein product [marine sediment metagenome]|uniref:NADP-dependent oxidoreductase domain-containing protein n=1 Tax=marine sediment metagenome TaxID=412755 RepID=X0UHT1_9ZZZZ
MMELAMGTVQLGMVYGIANYKGMLTDREADRLLDAAWDNGIRSFDSAPECGSAEKRIDDWRLRHPTRQVKVTSRVRPVDDESRFHAYDSRLWHVWGEDEIRHLDHKRNVDGVSLYNEEQVRWTDFQCGIYQLPASALDGRNDAIIRELKAKHYIVQIRSLFLQGHALQLPFLHKVASDYTMSVPELCVRWAHTLSCDMAVVGMETPKQIEENAKAFAMGPLPPSLVEQVYEIRRDIPEWAITMRMWHQAYNFGE